MGDENQFKLTRQFAVVSFLAITLSALLILLFFRFETTQSIEKISRDSNEALTIAIENALNDHMLRFLDLHAHAHESPPELDPLFNQAISKLLNNTNVVRVKIYDAKGYVAYSSKPSQIGDGQEDNPGFSSALQGKTTTVLIYRDTFNLLDQETEEDNLVQTYVPIWDDTKSAAAGVFEIYSDINSRVLQSNQIILLIWIIVTLVMLTLFAFQLLVIKRYETVIQQKHRETSERKKMLEMLSAKMITAQEDEKKRIAFELHEDVVQTIAGLKMQLERYILSADTLAGADIKKTTSELVPYLQDSARRIRAVAMDLRPPSLDDFGLESAIRSLIAECQTLSSSLQIETEFGLDVEQITPSLRDIIYRVCKDAVTDICFKERLQGHARFALRTRENGLVEMRVSIESDQMPDHDPESAPGFFKSMQERTILSGGEFELSQTDSRLEACSEWHSQ